MTQETSQTSQKPKTVRGTILGQFLAAQRLQNPAQAQAGDAQVGQERGLALDSVLGKVDEVRLQVRQRAGFKPGMLMDRRNQRRTEFFQAFNTTKKVEDPEPEQSKLVAPTQPAFTCPWVNEGCGFETDNPDVLKTHIELHTRFHPRTY